MKDLLRKSTIFIFCVLYTAIAYAQPPSSEILKVRYQSTLSTQYRLTEERNKPQFNGYSVTDITKGTQLHYSLYINLKNRTSLYLHDSTSVADLGGLKANINVITDFAVKSTKSETFKSERVYDQQFFSYGKVGDIEWELTNETKMINGLKCFKAKAKDRDLMLSAYYSKEIPVASGPSIYQGLPGLVVWVEDYFTTTELVDVEYIDLSKQQYDEMYKEFLSDFKRPENQKFKSKESLLIVKKSDAAHALYLKSHGKRY